MGRHTSSKQRRLEVLMENSRTSFHVVDNKQQPKALWCVFLSVLLRWHQRDNLTYGNRNESACMCEVIWGMNCWCCIWFEHNFVPWCETMFHMLYFVFVVTTVTHCSKHCLCRTIFTPQTDQRKSLSLHSQCAKERRQDTLVYIFKYPKFFLYQIFQIVAAFGNVLFAV